MLGALEDRRGDLLAVVVEGGVDAGHLQGVGAHGAERHGRLVLRPSVAVVHAECEGRLLHLGRAHVHDHLRVDGVHGGVGGRLDGEVRVAVVRVVLVLRGERGVAADDRALAGAVVERVRGDGLLVVRRGLVLQGGGQHDRLEGRAGLEVLAQGVARPVVREARAAVHRDDRAGLRVHGGGAGLHARVDGPVLAVEPGLQLVLDGLLQRGLLLGVDVERDLPAAGLQLLGGHFGLPPQFRVRGLLQIALLALHAGGGLGLDRHLELELLALLGVERLHLDHVVEHAVEADLDQPRAVRARGRQVVVAGRLEDGREVRALLQGQLVDVDAVVGLGGGLDAVRAAPEVAGVQVTGEDLVLLHVPVDLEGDHQLLELAGRRLVLVQVEVLDVLLGDRRTAGLALAGDRVEQPSGDAEEVDAAVLVEGLVLDGDEAGLDVLGDPADRHDLAVHLAVARHDRAVRVLVDVALRQGVGVGVGLVHVEVEGDECAHAEQEQPEERPQDLLPREEAAYTGPLAGTPLLPGGAPARRPPRTALLRLSRFCSAHRSRSARFPPRRQLRKLTPQVVTKVGQPWPIPVNSDVRISTHIKGTDARQARRVAAAPKSDITLLDGSTGRDQAKRGR